MICGIDPGLTGGIAFLSDGVVIAERTPVIKIAKKKYLDVASIVAMLQKHEPHHIYIEKQQAMPGQGVASTFRTGLGYGVYLGLFVALGLEYTEVIPRLWKKELNVPSDKNLSRARATEMFPHASSQWSLKCEDGVAEAAMIAAFGANRRMDQSDLLAEIL